MKTPLLLLALAIVLASLLVLTDNETRPARTATPQTAPVASTDNSAAAPDDTAMATYVLQRCGACHSLSLLSQRPQDAAGWTRVVNEMERLGARVSPSDEPALVAYLVRHFGS